MISLRTFTVLAIGVLLALPLAACDGMTHVATDLCQDDMDCPVTMHCDPATHLCVECLEDEDCPPPWRCDRAPAICVECLEDKDCLEGFRCIEKECVTMEEPPPAVAPEGEEPAEEPPEEEISVPPELGSTQVVRFTDDINDVRNCDTGEPAGPMEEPDIVAGAWLTPTYPISGVVGVEFASPLAPGTEVAFVFYNDKYPLPVASEDGWYIDGSGNLIIHVDVGDTLDTYAKVFSGGEWTTGDPPVQALTAPDVMAVYLVLAWDKILAAWPGFTPRDWQQALWFAAARSSTSCDDVGREEDEQDVGIEPVVPLLHQYWGEPQVEEEEPTPPPAPEPGAALPEEQARAAIDNFAQTWNAYMASGNIDGLLVMLFYPVFERYNRPQCRTELDRATGNPVHIEVLEVTWIGTWFWETDGLSTQLENVYAVRVRMTAGGESSEQWIHLVVLPDGSVWWLTDCGTPPTPTREPGAEPTTCYQEITAPARTAASIPFLLEWYGDPDHGDFELEFSADEGPWTRLPLDNWYPEGGHNKATITLNVGEGVLNVRVCRTGPSPCCGDIYEIIIYLESEPCH